MQHGRVILLCTPARGEGARLENGDWNGWVISGNALYSIRRRFRVSCQADSRKSTGNTEDIAYGSPNGRPTALLFFTTLILIFGQRFQRRLFFSGVVLKKGIAQTFGVSEVGMHSVFFASALGTSLALPNTSLRNDRRRKKENSKTLK
jgi:hypothetical protein